MDYKMDFTGSQKQLQKSAKWENNCKYELPVLRNKLQIYSTTDFWEQILNFMILTIFKNSWNVPTGKPISNWK